MAQLTLDNSATGASLPLYNTQESVRDIEGHTDVAAPFTSDRGEALITQLTGSERAIVSGVATANRVSNDASYSSDPLTGLAEWVIDLEETCHSQQGSAHSVTDNDRGETRDVYVENVSWQRKGGSIYEVEYAIQMALGTSPTGHTALSSETANPSVGSPSIGGYDMGSIKNVKVEIEQPTEEFTIAFGDTFDNANSYIPDGGSTRKFTITGTITGATARNTFDDNIRSLVANNSTTTYNESWPGRSFDVVIDNYDSTHAAGDTRLGDYNIELIEGRTP